MSIFASVDLSRSRPTIRGENFLPIKLTTSINGIAFTAQIGMPEGEGDTKSRKARLLKYLQGLNVESVEVTEREVLNLSKVLL